MFGAGVIDDDMKSPEAWMNLLRGLFYLEPARCYGVCFWAVWGLCFLQALEGVFAWMEGILLAFPYESAGDAFGKSKGDQPTLSFLLQGVAG